MLEKHRPYYSDTLGIDDPDRVIRGVYIGGCVDERNSWSIWDGIKAHAHNRTNSEWYGWMCFLEVEDVLKPSGRMTSTFAHEVAHLLCPNSGHTRKWKETVTKMGYGQEIRRCNLKPL